MVGWSGMVLLGTNTPRLFEIDFTPIKSKKRVVLYKYT